MLVKLAVSEPGANLAEEGYRWSIKDAYVPGWELFGGLGVSGQDGGPRRFGRFRLRYAAR